LIACIVLYLRTGDLRASAAPTLAIATLGYLFVTLFDEMARLSVENAAILRKVKENAIRRQKWLAVISHEIRTPLGKSWLLLFYNFLFCYLVLIYF